MENVKYLAIVGNLVYVLWILYNGVDEFKLGATTVHVAAYIGIILLLIFNALLLSRKK